MTNTIQLITPVITEGIRSLDDVEPLRRPDLEIKHSLLTIGPSSIESEFDEALAVPDTIAKAIEAEQAGANAIVIDCMGDPGLHSCREVVDIPVLGAGQTAMHIANMLGHRFGFVTVLDRIQPMIEKIIAGYGIKDKYGSFQSVDIPVLDLLHDVNELNNALSEKALVAIRNDGVDAIVLGCTGFLGCAEAITARLQQEGYNIPVIDPIPAAIHTAEMLVKLGVTQSKITYPKPDKKPIEGFVIPGYS